MAAPSTERNLLIGVRALQADLLSPAPFVEAGSLWASQKSTPLANLLVQRGWLTAADQADVERLLERKLAKHGGNARAGLAEVTTDAVRQSLVGITDDDIQHTIAPSEEPGSLVISTTSIIDESRARYTITRLHATGGIGRVWLARAGGKRTADSSAAAGAG